MKQTTITLWVKPEDEMHFLQILKVIDQLPIENTYIWNTKDVNVSRALISNWLWVSLSIELYIKFSHSWKFNGGEFA
jgi:hypothetical protein